MARPNIESIYRMICVMRHRTIVIASAAVVAAIFLWAQRRPVSTAKAAGPQRARYLIRFGMDGAKDIDWSGSVTPRPSRISGWQLDSGDTIGDGSWKAF